METLAQALFRSIAAVRYVALYRYGTLQLSERPDLRNASAAESDRYEELLVNPTILTLTTQRGNIDCGGLEFILIRYGNFFQLVHGIDGGHLSVAFEPHVDPLAFVQDVRAIARDHGLALQAISTTPEARDQV